MSLVTGTSICHMLLAEMEVLVNRISGIDEDGTVTEYSSYEADGAGVGDRFSWFVENNAPPAYHQEAISRDSYLYDVLSAKVKNSVRDKVI
jgi:L-ribulokinase